MKSFRQWRTSSKLLAGSIFLVLLMTIGIASFVGAKMYNALGKTYSPVERLPSDINVKVQPEPKEELGIGTQSLLIIGTDQRTKEEIGRADVIMLAIMNDQTKKITTVSIPRDTYVDIAGKGYKDKINHSLQYGVPTTIATVENYIGLKVDNYVLIDFEGFKKAVDAIGGVRVYVDKSISEDIYSQFPQGPKLMEGEQVLTGEQALFFSRFRYDTQGDFGRNDRQQKVLKAFLDQGKEVRSPAKINGLVNVLGEDVRTDLATEQIIRLASALNKYSSSQVKQLKFNAYTKTFGVDNLSYVIIPDEERDRVSEVLKKEYEKHAE